MTAGGATKGLPSGLLRRARIDVGAFSANVARLVENDPAIIVDARANAYGHGIEQIVRAALDAGASTVRVSPRDAALPGVRRSSLMTVASARTLVGAAAYGLDGDGTPVMTVAGEVISVKPTPEGSGVSYGYSYRTESDTVLALVALGYADGVPRLASNRASVSIGGAILPLVGRVAMDQFVVDCGTVVPKVGDEAVLWGSRDAAHPSPLDWAEQTERTALELTAGLGARVERVYS